MDLSIIIVSFNTKKLTQDCLASVIKSMKGTGISWEIILVDNVSTDGTRQMLKEKFPKVETILNKENVGFGRANNQGIRASHGEYILLLNSDTVIVHNAIGKLLAFARQHPNAFVGGKLLNLDHSAQTSCGPFFSGRSFRNYTVESQYCTKSRLGIRSLYYGTKKTIYAGFTF